MHRIFVAAVVFCFVGLPHAQEKASRDSASYPHGPDAIPLLRELWDFSADNIYPTHLGERFDSSALKRLEDRLRSADSVALADVLNPFLNSLGVSHTRLYDRRHQTYYMLRSLFSTRDLDSPQLYTIGVQLDDGEIGVVRAVMEDSPAAAVGVRRGDRIVAVDGVPFESLLQWQHGNSIRLTIEAEGGQRKVQLDPIRQSIHRALARATAASRQAIACGDRRIGYLHLWSGTNDVFLDTLTDAVANANAVKLDGFVLDLRDGYGGAWWPYLDPFFSNRVGYFTSTNYDSQGENETLRAKPQSNPEAWLGPLAVIINSGTRSGKESLAFQFKKSGRAKLFGTTTNGAFTGGLGAFAERDVDYMLYLAVQELQLDGTDIEGIGISPNVFVPEEIGKDVPLSAALDHLACRIASK